MKYEFTKDYLTGIGEIDKEHARLFEIANECYELVMDDAAVDRFDHIVALLDELRSYAATHFAHEEEYMERIQYERRFSERYQHLRFIQKLSGINLDDIDENQQEYLLKLLDFLAHWLYGHIKVMDCRIPREEDIAAQRAAAAAASAAIEEEPPAEVPVAEPRVESPAAEAEETAAATEASSAADSSAAPTEEPAQQENLAFADPEPMEKASAEEAAVAAQHESNSHDSTEQADVAQTEGEHPAAKKKAAKAKKTTTAKTKKTAKK